jgi:hypothetical protein
MGQYIIKDNYIATGADIKHTNLLLKAPRAGI